MRALALQRGHGADTPRRASLNQARGATVALPAGSRSVVLLRAVASALPASPNSNAPLSVGDGGSGSSSDSSLLAGARSKPTSAPPAASPPGVLGAVDTQQVHRERASSHSAATTSSRSGGSARGSGKGPSAPSAQRSGPAKAPGDRGGRDTGRSFNTWFFTSQLNSATTVGELRHLFDLHRTQDMNSIHLATLWYRLAKLSTSSSRATSTTSGQAAPAAADASPAPAGALEGAAAAQPRAVQRAAPSTLLAFAHSLEAATTQEQLANMQARGLSNVIWAVAKLAPECAGAAPARPAAAQPQPVRQRGPQQQGNELAAPGGGEGAGAQQEAQGAPAAGAVRERPVRVRDLRKVMAAAAAEAASAAAAGAGAASPVVSQAFLAKWAAATSGKLATLNMQDISNTVWALGRLNYEPSSMFLTQLSIALLKELPRADRPQQLSNVLLGFALLKFAPPIKDFWPPMWQALGQVVLAERTVPDMQGISNSLWALSRLSASCPGEMPAVPPELVSKAVFRAVQRADCVSAVQCQDLLAALPSLGFAPSEFQAAKLLALTERVLPSCDAQALSVILISLLHLRVRPPQRWMRACIALFGERVPLASPESLARMLLCLAKTKSVPPKWLPQVWSRIALEAHTFNAADLAFTALATSLMYPQLVPTPPQEVGEEGVEAEAASGAEEAADATASAAAAAPDAAADPGAADGAAAAAGARKRKVPPPPPREVLVALRDAWEGVGAEAQLMVVFETRAHVQEFFAAALAD